MMGVPIALEVAMAPGPIADRVPDEQIWGGSVPQGTPLPILLFLSITSNDHATVAPGERVRTTDRVRVAVRADTYQEKADLLALVQACFRDRIGAWAGTEANTIHLDGVGPDMEIDTGIYEQSQDLLVSFNRTT
jgi:hypothetical protein